MKSTLLLMMLALILAACQNDSNEQQEPTTETQETQDSTEEVMDSSSINSSESKKVERTSLQVKKADLPQNYAIEGEFLDAFRVAEGDKSYHLVVSLQNLKKGHQITSAYYQDQESEPKLIAQFQQQIEPCDFDLVSKHISESVSVTDVDNDGTPEISTMFLLDCTSDVSPNRLHLALFEGEKVYSLKGRSMVIGEGGDFSASSNLQQEQQLLNYASGVWEANMEENH